MRKLKLLLVWALILVMISPTFTFAATPDEEAKALGTTHGELAGRMDGTEAGKADQAANKVEDYLKVLPADSVIANRISKVSSYTYRNAYITSYKLAFQLAYSSAFREANMQVYIKPIENASTHGTTAGNVQGQVSAMIDITKGVSDDWNRAFNAYISEGSLDARYFLTRENTTYREMFKSAFRDAFMDSYIDTYQNRNLDLEIRNKNAKLISKNEAVIDFSEEYINFTLGSMAAEIRTPMTLTVPKAAIYEPTYIAVFEIQNSFNANNYEYQPVSGKYTVAVWNDRHSIELLKPLVLTFEYYGSERAGVYQWQNNKWVYQYTTQTDNSLSIEIPAGVFKGGEYAIFIDNNYKLVKDINFNWAYKEIYSLIRRNVISDDQLFSPNSKITRAQLAQMVYNMRSSADPLNSAVPYISDSASFGSYKPAIEYMVGKGYMKLDSKAAFNMKSNVTYTQFESMLSMMFTRTFSWDEIANKMKTEKYKESEGLTKKSALMTKAEVAYALYTLFK